MHTVLRKTSVRFSGVVALGDIPGGMVHMFNFMTSALESVLLFCVPTTSVERPTSSRPPASLVSLLSV